MDTLIGQRAAPADYADGTWFVDVAGHDADLALAGRDDAGAVWANQPTRLFFEKPHGPSHVENWDAFRDGDNDRDTGIGRLHNRVGRGRRRHEDHGGVGAGLAYRLSDGVEKREAFLRAAAFARRDGADDLRAVLSALLRMKRASLAEALNENAGRLID